jgi:hypothetical protein
VVDFKKRLAGKKAEKPIDPIQLYDTLDRAHDKGPLRPAQTSVLQDWFEHHQATRDVIVKLHTGQGEKGRIYFPERHFRERLCVGPSQSC